MYFTHTSLSIFWWGSVLRLRISEIKSLILRPKSVDWSPARLCIQQQGVERDMTQKTCKSNFITGTHSTMYFLIFLRGFFGWNFTAKEVGDRLVSKLCPSHRLRE